VGRLLIFVLTLALLATACGSSGTGESASVNDSSDLVSEPSRSQANSGSLNSGSRDSAPQPESGAGDAMNDAMDDAMAMDEEEAMEDDAMDDTAMGEVAGVVPQQATNPNAYIQPDASAAGRVRATIPPQAPRDASTTTSDGDAEGLFSQPAPDVEEPAVRRADPSRLEDNRFQFYGYREFIETDEDPFSTFALDVDTGSYSVARRWLEEGVQPPPESVRVEEFVNSFDYDYQVPRRGLEISVDGGPSPFDRDNMLVRVGVQAEEIPDGERPPVALTFIVDTSGSMDRDDRLGLVKDSLEILVDELNDDDTVAIVVYSNNSGVVLEPTEVRDSRRIYAAIDSLSPGGSTNLESGLREGYALAASAFRNDGVNRVIIASDGVANAGITDEGDLGDFIRNYADEGIQLVTVGYGMGNFNDTMMEQLAPKTKPSACSKRN